MGVTFKTLQAALAITLALGGPAGAQTAPFMFRVALPGGEPASQSLAPPPLTTNDGAADFGSGSNARYTVNALVGEPFSLPS